MRLKVGDVVRVAHSCLGNPAGTIAVVVEVYDRAALRIGLGEGVTLLFRNGAHDGFSPDDQLAFGVERLGHRPTLAHYHHQSASRLWTDWRAGLFAEVWDRDWI